MASRGEVAPTTHTEYCRFGGAYAAGSDTISASSFWGTFVLVASASMLDVSRAPGVAQRGTSRALWTDLGAARLGTARTTLSVCSRAQLDDLGEMLVDG